MRRVLYFMHLYAGLFFGAAVVFVGVTGSAVMYRPEIEQLLNPEWFRASAPGEMRPLDELVANAVQTYPAAVPTFVSIQPPLGAGEAAMVIMKDRFGAGSGPWIRAHVDPYTGAVLASFDPRQTFSGVLFDLHSSLLVGEHTWGEQIVGVFGIVLLLFCVTGAVLWWPGTRSVIRALKVRWKGGAFTVNYDLHRVAGIALLVPLTLVALTGIVLVFPSTRERRSSRLSTSSVHGRRRARAASAHASASKPCETSSRAPIRPHAWREFSFRATTRPRITLACCCRAIRRSATAAARSSPSGSTPYRVKC